MYFLISALLFSLCLFFFICFESSSLVSSKSSIFSSTHCLTYFLIVASLSPFCEYGTIPCNLAFSSFISLLSSSISCAKATPLSPNMNSVKFSLVVLSSIRFVPLKTLLIINSVSNTISLLFNLLLHQELPFNFTVPAPSDKFITIS